MSTTTSIPTLTDAGRHEPDLQVLSDDLVKLLMSEASGFRLVRAAYGRHRIDGLRSMWRPWEVFARYHDLDARDPDDTALVAYIEAKAGAGAGFNSLRNTLMCVVWVCDHTWAVTRRTVAAHRHLADLWSQGEFDPSVRQAPLLSVGEVAAICDAAGRLDGRQARDDKHVMLLAARDTFLTRLMYAGALRPDEPTWVDLDQIAVDDRGVDLILPQTKSGAWVRHRVEDVHDLVASARWYLKLREPLGPGPLLVDRLGELGRVDTGTVTYTLRSAAAAAGVERFSAYSMRRSRAMHAWLLGTEAADLRRLLRHTSEGTYTRYVEPLHALMDDDLARQRFLDPTRPDGDPLPVAQVRGSSSGASRVTRYAFVGGPLEHLLDGIEMPKLRVNLMLADLDVATIEQGRRTFRRFAGWMREQGLDPTDPDDLDLTDWASELLGDLEPQTVSGYVRACEIGWQDATDIERTMQGRETAMQMLQGAIRRQAGNRRFKSREATDDDLEAILREVPAPPLAWAQAVIATVTRARGPVRVLRVDRANEADVAVVEFDGQQQRLREGPGQLICPVEAARMLLDAGVETVDEDPSWARVFKLAEPTTVGLRDDAILKMFRASGGRRSDLSRARRAGYDPDQPGGTAVWLAARKGRKPSRNRVNPSLLWLPDDDLFGAADALAAWVAWWPYDDGPLLPTDPGGSKAARGELTRMTPSAGAGVVDARVAEQVAIGNVEEGLTSHGWRYALAGRMHDAGEPPEVIQVALGHTDVATTVGYCQQWNPFNDGDLDAMLDHVTSEFEKGQP